MNHQKVQSIFSIFVLFGMVLGMVSPVQGASQVKPSYPQVSDTPAQITGENPGEGFTTSVTTASDENLRKFNNKLKSVAKSGGADLVNVRLLVTDNKRLKWPDFIQAIPRAIPDEATGLQVWYGRIQAKNLAKLASLDFVVSGELTSETGPIPRFRPDDFPSPQVTDEMRERLRDLRDNPPTAGPLAPAGTTGWWDVGPGHLSKEAWEKGYTGDGVRVADLDSGVDFCHPDLMDTWAIYDVSDSRNITYNGVSDYYDYFDGWPIALSPVSNQFLFFDMFFNGEMTDLNTFAYGITKFADTRTSGVGDTIYFDGREYATTGTAAPGTKYHIGYHPDTSLEAWWWGERIGVLVVDEDGDDIFETVYVDLNDNQDFSDDQPATINSPTSCWDADEDGYNDLSGGLVYFIADGLHWPQGVDWWWDPDYFAIYMENSNPPGNGDLVAFMFDDPLGPAQAHGTLTAGNITGQGKIDGDPSIWGSTEVRPSWKPTGVGGMIQGAGKDAKLITIGDIYWNFEDSTETGWYFASFGVDGYGDTDDGAQISSNSYGEDYIDNDEWDNRSRLLTRLNTRSTYAGYPNTYGQRITHLFSTGNGAPGYGTTSPPNGSTTIGIGASTQMGSTGWDSISGPGQIVWGDVIPWSNRGPTAVGHLAPQVTADGAYAAGAISSNAWGDGWTAWETWGGTSRSSPVAAGNLALIYDAWKQRTGDWPTWEQARELLMSGASDQMYDVLEQGAGMVNADKATDIAGGLAGVQVSPSEWYPGDYRGTEYLSFAQIIQPGSDDDQEFTLENYGTQTETVSLDATYFEKISSEEFTVNATASRESTYTFNRPDYLFNIGTYAPGGIPKGTALMQAELLQTFDQFEPQGDNDNDNNNNWRVLWYSHTDLDADGKIYNDTNGNGVVNAGEEETGEYVRFSYGFNAHTYHQVSVKDPLDPERWKDGIYLGLQHRWHQDTLVPVTNLKVRVTFYRKSTWDWLSFSSPNVEVSPDSSNTVTAYADIPADTPYGLYEGAIELDGGDYQYLVPVVINVAFSGDLTAEPVTLGGQPKTSTPYDNSFVSGSQDWTWRAESGDWRFFFLDQDTEPNPGTYLVARDEWGDAAPETDLDTLILAPTSGEYENVMSPLIFNYGDFSTLDPTTFGPYRLEVIASSPNTLLGDGIWAFDTATGGNVDYVVGELQGEGLHEVLQHTVRYEGDQFEIPFTKTLSTLTGPTSDDLTYTNYFTDDISFSSNITYTEGITVEVYGLSMTGEDFTGLSIEQDPTNDDPCDFDAGGIYTYTTSLGSNVAEFLAHVAVGSNDLDMFMLYDSDHSGTFECPGEQIASSTNSAGSDDEIGLKFPDAGDYMVVIQGWSVSPSPSVFDWYWERVDLDNSIAVRNTDLSINPSKPATFELYNVNPDACSQVMASCNDGILYVGLEGVPRLFSIPITVDYEGPDIGSASSKSVSPSEAVPGDELTYVIKLINSSYTYTATGVLLTDTLPAEVEFGGFVEGGAVYSDALDAVLWQGNISTTIPGQFRPPLSSSFVDISSTGTAITWPSGDDDEGHAEITLPWDFPWFGTSYGSVWADANGELCFGGACSGGGFTYNDDNRIPSANNPNNRIAAFYEDMLGPNTASSYSLSCSPDAVYYEYESISNRLIIQYNDWCSWEDGYLNTFEVILYEDGVMEVLYDSVPSAPPNLSYGNPPGDSDVGLENSDGSEGKVWSGTVADDAGWGFGDIYGAHGIVYTATVRSDVPDGTIIANEAEVNNGLGMVSIIGLAETEVHNANFSTSTKSVDKDTATADDQLTYEIDVSNSGVVDADNATLIDYLPDNTAFLSASAGVTYSDTINAVLWEGAVDSMGTIPVTYTVDIVGPLTSHTMIYNTAQVGDGFGTFWWTNEVSTEILSADLSLFDKHASTTNLRMGEVVTYTVHLRNTGDSATKAIIVDYLPDELDLFGSPWIVSGPGSIEWANDVITWTGVLDYEYLDTEVVLRFAAEQDGLTPCQVITNTAFMYDAQDNTGEASVNITSCGYLYFVPLINK